MQRAAYCIGYVCNMAGCDRKGKLIAVHEFHGILGGGNDDFLLQFSYIFSYSKNVWLETICLIWKKVASRHILYIEIIDQGTYCTYGTVRSTVRHPQLTPLAPFG